MIDPSVPGKVRCMKCQKQFLSPDRLRIRRCKSCKGKDTGYHLVEVRLRELEGRQKHGINNST